MKIIFLVISFFTIVCSAETLTYNSLKSSIKKDIVEDSKKLPIPANQEIDPTSDKYFSILKSTFEAKFVSGGRYMETNCKAPDDKNTDLEKILSPYRKRQSDIKDGSSRFPLCDSDYYTEGNAAHGRVIMMNADAEQIARWVVTECQIATKDKITRLNYEQCIISAARMIWFQANAQYPITGMVAEPGTECKKEWKKGEALFGFRHGVTVGIEGVPETEDDVVKDDCKVKNKNITPAPSCTKALTKDGKFRMDNATLKKVLTGSVLKTAKDGYARLSNLAIWQHYNDDTLTKRCPRWGGNDENQQPEWLDYVRDSYLKALGENRYELLGEWLSKQDSFEKENSCVKTIDSKLLTISCKDK